VKNNLKHCLVKHFRTGIYLKLFLSLFLVNTSILFAQPVAEFNASNVLICTGQSTIFSNASSGTITSYSWNFGSGASPATATSAGPHTVTYATSGLKTVSITVNGPSGNSTKTKTGFIKVGFDRIKIMNYNMLNYPFPDAARADSDTTVRNPYFRTILTATDPDILVTEEMTGPTAITGILDFILNSNSNTYSSGTFIDGDDSDNGIFFKTSKFTFVSNTRIYTALRDINEFKLIHSATGDTLRIYAVHLKASSGATNEDLRAAEVDSLRKFTNALPAGTDFIVCGDFNIYKSSESAYQKLIFNSVGDDGHFIDPITISGTWNNPSYAAHHTQSTRDIQIGGGASGGLDDRFDMMLYSNAISQAGGISFVPGSVIPYGNDGNHYGLSINAGTNTAVGSTIANALFYGSDHIPIIESFDFQLVNCQLADLGVQLLLSPATPTCPSTQKTVQVRIKNFSASTINFSNTNLEIALQITQPNSSVQSLNHFVTSGTLNSGATLDVAFTSHADMSLQGNYIFNANTIIPGDANASNNSMPATTIEISPGGVATISPSGPINLCGGNSQTLTASSGNQYSWSTGATTQSIVVTNAGSYSVNVNDINGCLSTAAPVEIITSSYSDPITVLAENIGNVGTSTVAISTHENNNGFDNDVLTMTGTADVRNTTFFSQVSTSGGANVFFTNTSGRNLIISGINTSGKNNLQLSFSIQKNMVASDGGDFLLKASTDGINYTDLSFPPLATGTGSTSWQNVTLTTPLPSAPNLRLQFIQTSTTVQYRLDDILLTGILYVPSITSQGPTTFCNGDSVQLISSVMDSYLWSNGNTTQNIYAKTAVAYSVTATSPNGCTATSNSIMININSCTSLINLKVFIEGYYLSNGEMIAVSNPVNQPLVCDTMILQLASSTSPYNILYSDTALLNTNGSIQFTFVPAIINNNYYLVIRHRSALETWSANFVMINDNILYDFTTIDTKAFGNNLKDMQDGRFALWSGDINQDGQINNIDFSILENSLQLFKTGYLKEDLNGDGIAESCDWSLIENNLQEIRERP
jgi:PKD repeat protein